MSRRRSLVLQALKNAGPRGATTAHLCHPSVGGSRFGGRIKELREQGYVIESECLRAGSWLYTLIEVPAVSPAPASSAVASYPAAAQGPSSPPAGSGDAGADKTAAAASGAFTQPGRTDRSPGAADGLFELPKRSAIYGDEAA